jgi:proline dehydrogenase
VSNWYRAPVLSFAHHPAFRRIAAGTKAGRLLASRFVAGETLDDAIGVARELNRGRISSMLDHLGENVETTAQATQAANDYIRAIERIRDESTLDAAISIKLTQLGLDFSEDLCLAHVNRILDAADAVGTTVMIDMEAHGYVDATLEVFRKAHAEHGRVGLCLQAYLRRTAEDVFDLPGRARIRLVKGAYLEPPDVAMSGKAEVDEAFGRLFATLLGREHPVDVATHDPRLIEGVKRTVGSTGSAWSRVEFQMLYGIRRDLQNELARDGYAVRVYIPYGTEWYPYLTRRLAERPANLWFFLSNLVRSGR